MSVLKRPTTFADALINAALKTPNVNEKKGTGNWVARRVLLNTERPNFAIVVEVHTKKN